MANDKQMENIAKMLSKKLNMSSDEIVDSMKSGNVNPVLNSLSSEQRSKVNSILSNPEITKKLMEDKGVQDILRKLDL
ncbi:MAG: hypothetical protein E7532_01840 [Ruminococcaceae bacterium]|nr:hypothetical protein [Oscillospiraceae bacterium]